MTRSLAVCLAALLASCSGEPTSSVDSGTDSSVGVDASVPRDSSAPEAAVRLDAGLRDASPTTDSGEADTGREDAAAPAGPVVAVACGGHHSCALLADGRVWCWGNNAEQQLGVPLPFLSSTPLLIDDAGDAAQLSVGYSHACVRTTRGTVRCWGSDETGALGARLPDRADPRPREIPDLTGVVQVAAGGGFEWEGAEPAGLAHSCALLEDGTVQCWGDNTYGQLGDGTTIDRGTPAPVPALSGVVELGAGGLHTCARTTDGRIHCWGDNVLSQLGLGPAMPYRASPAEVPGVSESNALMTGTFATCVLGPSGGMTCWGLDPLHPRASAFDPEARTTPHLVSLPFASAPTSVIGGVAFLCATGEGRVECAGRGSDGQLGDGTTPAHRATFGPTIALPGPTLTAAGGAHACAVASGEVLCWGLNWRGALGDGTTTSRAAPTPVLWPPTAP